MSIFLNVLRSSAAFAAVDASAGARAFLAAVAFAGPSAATALAGAFLAVVAFAAVFPGAAAFFELFFFDAIRR